MSNQPTNTWPEMAMGLFDALTARKAEISYEMDNLSLAIPSATGEDSRAAKWVFNGTLRIQTRDGVA